MTPCTILTRAEANARSSTSSGASCRLASNSSRNDANWVAASGCAAAAASKRDSISRYGASVLICDSSTKARSSPIALAPAASSRESAWAITDRGHGHSPNLPTLFSSTAATTTSGCGGRSPRKRNLRSVARPSSSCTARTSVPALSRVSPTTGSASLHRCTIPATSAMHSARAS